MSKKLNLTLHVWRQKAPSAAGDFVKYAANGIDDHMSFLEMLDVVNEGLIAKGDDPIAFDHDCREGICGSCGVMINGMAHGPRKATTACQLHMRVFHDGDEIWIEPWRAAAFPVIKDLVVDRGALDRIVQSGGYVSVRTGQARDANNIAVRKEDADLAMDAAQCIGCGACVAACPNASASLFTSAKIGHLALLPQGGPEREDRVRRMVLQHDAELFGSCTQHGECEAACPKEISIDFIARMNADFIKTAVTARSDLKPREGQ